MLAILGLLISRGIAQGKERLITRHPNDLVQWIENYCKQNPLSPFTSAVDEMLEIR